jgi:hypothetical protein
MAEGDIDYSIPSEDGVIDFGNLERFGVACA